MSPSPVNGDERGVAVAADEAELARMGYKQELKFVHVFVGRCCVLTFLSFPQERPQSYAGTVFLSHAGVQVSPGFTRTLVSLSLLSAS
jgi:hypothetical protein